jgi:hypothetical protein
MKPLFRVALVALLCAPLARPAAAQANGGDHPYKWYWGGQAGALLYRTNAQKWYFDPLVGVHWMITRKRGALTVGGEEAFFTSDATAGVTDFTTGTGYTVAFSKVRRIFAGLIAYPLPGHLEPIFGGGIGLNTVVDPRANSAAGQFAADEASNWANFWLLGGIQINVGNLAVYGQYVLGTSASNKLLRNEQHSIQGGVRYALGKAREDVQSSH